MEQATVKNTTNELIAVLWDGANVYFKPGQKKLFSVNIARALAGENEGLLLEIEEPMLPNGTDVTDAEDALPAQTEPKAPEADDATKLAEFGALIEQAKTLGVDVAKFDSPQKKGLLVMAIRRAEAKKA